MVELDNLAEKVFALLKGNGLKIKIFDNEGAETTDPSIGRRFFVLDPNLMVTIDEEENRIELSKGKSVGSSVDSLQKNLRKIADEFLMNTDVKVFGKAIQPRDYAYQAKMQKDTVMNESINSQLLGRVLKELDYAAGMTAKALCANIPGSDLNQVQQVLNKLVADGKVDTISSRDGRIIYGKKVEEAVYESTGEQSDLCPSCKSADVKTFSDHEKECNDCGRTWNHAEHNKTKESIAESFSKMFGSLKTSQQTLENVRILVKHKTPVDENVRGSRSRHISAIFLESNGERFRFPHNYLSGARAMAQHMAHGGTMGDKVGAYIIENTGNLLKLQSFNRYVTTNKLINEDSSNIIETVKENIETIRTELKKLTGVKTYETVKARLETFEREALSEDDVSGLKDLFTIRRFDEKFEEVLPIVKQLVQEKDTYHKRVEEAAANTVYIRRELISVTPMFEFASENARLGYKLNELSLRILENEELASFVNKVGTKLCREGVVNEFEKAVLTQVLENLQIEEKTEIMKEIKESADLSAFFDKYDKNFY